MHSARSLALGWLLVLTQVGLFAGYVMAPSLQPDRLPSWPWRAPALALAAAGAALSTAGLWAIRDQLTPLPHPQASTRLKMTGPFGVSRHPIYTGLLLACLGWALWRCDLSRVAATAVLGMFFWGKASLEERLLLERFPEDYPPYARRVKRLLPW